MSRADYETLCRRFHRISTLGEALATLHWDSAVMMPSGGAARRSDQIATLTVLQHDMLTAPDLGDLLLGAEAAPDLDDWQQANLREMRRRWRHATALPPDLVQAHSEATSACEMIWREARARNDFAAVAAPLQLVLDLTRERAAAKSAALNVTPYDALLDSYDSGLRTDDVVAAFASLRRELPVLLDQIRGDARPADPALAPAMPAARQAEIARDLIAGLGFDFNHGRIDSSHHPFTGGIPDDVRITTRYDPANLLSGLLAVLHEFGHAMYERGLPEVWRNQPVGGSLGMSIHESQSLIIEMQAVRSDQFLTFLSRRLAGLDTSLAASVGFAALVSRIRRVAPGLIRVDADEVTYPLHVILRFDLERLMLDGDLGIADLPEAWNEGMRTLLGIQPPDHRDGCLQDIHWMGGDFGYFPTYTLGAIAAAQLFKAARKELPGITDALTEGDLSPLLDWLRRQVHCHGRRDGSAADLLRRVTGQGFDTAGFLDHLRQRYHDRP